MPFLPKRIPFVTTSCYIGNFIFIIEIYSLRFFVRSGSQKPEKEILPVKLIELSSSISLSNTVMSKGVGIFG